MKNMNRWSGLFIKLLSGLLLLLAANSWAESKSKSKSEPSATNSEAKVVMHKNLAALVALQPYLARKEAFAADSNQKEISHAIEELGKLSHKNLKAQLTQDPSLQPFLGVFNDYIESIQKAYKSNRTEFARNKLRTLTWMCTSCHSNMDSQKRFDAPAEMVNKLKLSALEKAEFFAATRQIDKAFDAIAEIIASTQEDEFSIIEFSRAVRLGLSLTVRFKKDPKETFYFLERLAARKDLPEFFKVELKNWKEDTKDWMAEKRDSQPSNALGLFQKAKALSERAQKKQLFKADHSGDVSFLRSIDYLHQALQKSSVKGEVKIADAMYLLGIAYEALQDPMLWSLDELYFESCIAQAPHSETAKKCFKRYSSQVYWGYSGSSGTFIPDDELKKLKELRKLSE